MSTRTGAREAATFLRMLRGVVIVAAAAASMMGCSYKSEYQPPKDGRARPVWDDDKVVMVAPPELPSCVGERQPPPSFGYHVPMSGGYWAGGRGGGHVHVHVVVIGHPPPLLVPGPIIPGGDMDGEGAKYLLVGLAAAAIVAFPFIAMGLAMGHPEPEEEVASAIDKINRYNDLARERMAQCAAWTDYNRASGGARR